MIKPRHLLFLLLITLICAQDIIASKCMDTIEINLKDVSIPYRKLKNMWFGDKIFTLKGYVEFSINTTQDSILREYDSTYFKIYDRKNRLLLEGRRLFSYSMLTGKVIFYYKNGEIKRIESYAADWEIPEGQLVLGADGTRPWGTWIYMNRRGIPRKCLEYFAKTSGDGKQVCEIKETTVRPFGRMKMKKEVIRCRNKDE